MNSMRAFFSFFFLDYFSSGIPTIVGSVHVFIKIPIILLSLNVSSAVAVAKLKTEIVKR